MTTYGQTNKEDKNSILKDHLMERNKNNIAFCCIAGGTQEFHSCF